MATWTNPRTWATNEVVTAALLNAQVRDNLKTLGDAWTAYTPTLAGGITAIGNGSVSGRYSQSGKLVRGTALIAIGTTTTLAAANILIGLPVVPLDADRGPVGTGIIEDLSVGVTARYGCTAHLTTSATVRYMQLITGTAGQYVTNTVPFTWANQDIIAVQFQYEAA